MYPRGRAAQGRGFAVRVLPLEDEPPDDELPDEALLPDDDDEGGGGEYVLRGRSDAVPLELPCVCVYPRPFTICPRDCEPGVTTTIGGTYPP